MERHGAVHVMVPNAGVGIPCPLLQMDLVNWREVTSVNLDGVFLRIRYAAPAIIVAGGGAIVTIGSVTATAGAPLIGHYAAAKAGVVNLTKTAASELHSDGVRVNVVLPGFVATDLVTTASPEFERFLGLSTGVSTASSSTSRDVTERRMRSPRPHSSSPADDGRSAQTVVSYLTAAWMPPCYRRPPPAPETTECENSVAGIPPHAHRRYCPGQNGGLVG